MIHVEEEGVALFGFNGKLLKELGLHLLGRTMQAD